MFYWLTSSIEWINEFEINRIAYILIEIEAFQYQISHLICLGCWLFFRWKLRRYSYQWYATTIHCLPETKFSPLLSICCININFIVLMTGYLPSISVLFLSYAASVLVRQLHYCRLCTLAHRERAAKSQDEKKHPTKYLQEDFIDTVVFIWMSCHRYA